MASSHARHLRTHSTDAERVLWRHLRAYRLRGHKFRRQAPIGRYIVDFVCFELRLVIELDGGQHAERTKYESDRTAWLRGQGFRVLRFWNTDVLNNLEGVRGGSSLRHVLGDPLSLTLPHQGGGDEEKGRAVDNAFRSHSLGRRTPCRLDTPAEFWHLSPQSRPVVRAFDARATGSEEGGSPSFSCMQGVGACAERIDTRQSGGPSAWLARKSP